MGNCHIGGDKPFTVQCEKEQGAGSGFEQDKGRESPLFPETGKVLQHMPDNAWTLLLVCGSHWPVLSSVLLCAGRRSELTESNRLKLICKASDVIGMKMDSNGGVRKEDAVQTTDHLGPS